ncbi:amidophosphoribosyltransferase [Sulfurisphaera ohwakuensis]|uniref:Amidophosphoribosyltransferase n=1 Tax=Sulfurisphaera ohwakuensis TaxID=69656 RepID=A0A650CI33_SULOH|nr:amidophosphoribosyltransferase [Sulfurisphaera ohwakuensis]MBB5252331.1 amidophosphoribosyltransferase [Sulfurisphaera ohwakuensis]QGR17207.1 amidophosphoribosyltransferase [Sulfurisphaera ohwakuensis]
MKVKEHCGIVGVYADNSPMISYESLKLLQHRGQESAGITYRKDGSLVTMKGLGLVEEALDPRLLPNAKLSIGHVRYSTTGKGSLDEAQPLSNGKIAIAFNGTITNYFKFGTSTDTEFILKVLSEAPNIKEGIRRLVDLADGAYSLVVLTNDGELIGFRDPKGFRPLVLGKINNGYIIASEDSVIRQLGGKPLRDVKPGEMIYIKDGEIESEVISRDRVSFCSFEYIYFARPDSIIDGVSVYNSRIKLGEILAENHGVDADVVIPVPESSIPIAIGFSRKSKIPMEYGLIRTLVAKRSFIMPTQDKRNAVLEEKFGIVKSVVENKKVIVIDDSIVRGNTMRKIVRMIRDNGAKEVHVRIGSPKVKYPCYMGIDFPLSKELIASEKDEKEIAKYIGADSVEFLTVEEMIKAIGRPDLCHACFSGVYPLKFSYNLQVLESIFKKVS